MRIFIYILLLMLFVGCNSKEQSNLKFQIKQLQIQNDSLKIALEKLSSTNKTLRAKVIGNYIKNEYNKGIKKHSNQEIIDILIENRKFYCPDIAEYKDFTVREIEPNIYDVKFKTKEPEPSGFQLAWVNQIYRMTFTEGDKFILKHIQGSMPCS